MLFVVDGRLVDHRSIKPGRIVDVDPLKLADSGPIVYCTQTYAQVGSYLLSGQVPLIRKSGGLAL